MYEMKIGGNTQRLVENKGRRRDVPGRVAPGLEGIADTAIGETRRIGLLLDEQFARELLDYTAFAVVLDKGIVLFGRTVGKRVKPVGIVRSTHFEGPFAHAGSDAIGYLAAQRSAVVDRLDYGFVGLFGQILEHLLPVEDISSVILRRPLLRKIDGDCFPTKSFFRHFES